VRAEFLTITLAVLCLVAPELEARLREVGPGRGRASGAAQVEGAAQLFAIADGLPDAAKKVSVSVRVLNCLVGLLRVTEC
jgi:hypothetical protein